MIDLVTNFISEREPYALFIVPIVVGVYILLAHGNLLKSIVGLYLIQTGVISFFVLLSVRQGATVPILDPEREQPLHNPLPHALMLTAIVVSVATLGVALAIVRRIQAENDSIQDWPAGGIQNSSDHGAASKVGAA